MINLNKNQLNIWKSMIQIIHDYQNDIISFDKLTTSLEGALDAADIKDMAITNEWYENWSSLEMLRAEKDITVPLDLKLKEITKMKVFLQKVLDIQK